MAGPFIGVQFGQRRYDACSNRIQVDVPDEFQQIGVFLTDNGFKTVLEEVAAPVMTKVEFDGIPGQEALHHFGQDLF
jgi:hypothetical protein